MKGEQGNTIDLQNWNLYGGELVDLVDCTTPEA